jgi:ADP-dependent NAD(P)H-hydrate dehydratase / NAD(P)H-hydrate epimerase
MTSHYLHNIDVVRNIEEAYATTHPKISLMQRAGEAVAKHALVILKKSTTKNILILAGPGNNGGDAWVAAEALRKRKANVTVLSLGEQTWPDAAAKKAFNDFRAANGEVIKAWPKKLEIDLVIDGLFGIGISKAPSGAFADTITQCNDARLNNQFSVLAVDVPSGLNANTGAAFQPSIEADETITFITDKPGLHTADGRDHAGKVSVEALGIAAQPSQISLLTQLEAAALIPRRRANSHKGSYGNVGIIGGADGMAGAAVLAARAALSMGPGKVFLGLFDKDRPAYDVLNPEIMLRDARELAKDDAMTAFAVGMGTGETGMASIMSLLALNKPLVVDADALNAIASNPSIRAAFQAKKTEIAHPTLPFIFTPHPGEAARLLDVKTVDIQADRLHAALKIAQTFHVVTILKGAGSIIAHPDGRIAINPTGNPGMASGGTGDALAGMLAAFLAIGLNAWDAARLGTYLHGAAGDAALHHGMGPHGLTASDVIFEARGLLNAGLVDEHDDD